MSYIAVERSHDSFVAIDPCWGMSTMITHHVGSLCMAFVSLLFGRIAGAQYVLSKSSPKRTKFAGGCQ